MRRGAADSTESPREMSKAEVLRGFVTERLAAASQEILAAVDRIVAEYEEEASGFRREIARQRRLLEAALQPRVILNKTGAKCSRSFSHVEEEEGEDEDVRNLDQKSSSRSFSSRDQFEQRNRSRPQISETQKHMDVRIHILEDPQITVLSKNDVQHLLVIKEEVPPELSPGLDQEDPESPHIKEEQEELWSSQEGEQLQGPEEADDTKVPLTAVDVKSEDDEEKPQSSQPPPSQSEESREAEPPDSSSAEQMEAEADGEDCGGSEPARNSDPHIHLQPDTDDDTDEEVSDSFETEVSDDDDWKETRAPESGLKINEVHVNDPGCDTGEETFSCSECGKRFCKKFALQRHMKIHTKERPYGCDVCGKRFLRHGNLKVHMRVHTGEKPYGCDSCGKRYMQQGNLTVHMRVHTGEKPFGCSFCGKRFKRQGELNMHMKVHTGEKPFGCDVCGKTFLRQGNLKVHMRGHSGERPFGCCFCGKRFKRQDYLKGHMRVHTGEKPLSCDVCGKGFNKQDHLTGHMRVHTGETPFGCDVCGKRFKLKGNLKMHIRIHTGEKPFGCDVCGKRFTKQHHLIGHMRIHTGEKLCGLDVCGKKIQATGETSSAHEETCGWMRRGAADSTESPREMSKAEVLRGFVTERLAAASQEILAAVDRIVAEYEEEASGFRREIARQRRLLEAALQPRVTPNKAGVKRSRSLCHAEEEDGEDRDDDSLENPEDLNNSPSRSFSSRDQFEQRNHSRAQISEAQNHVDLRIRILEDPRTEVLSKNVLKKCPLLKLRCPQGLQEADFLDLLRSTFPQLGGDNKPFDIFTSNKRRRLKRLKLKAVTPQEIHRHISSGGGASTLFIRLKAQTEASEEEVHPLQTKDSSTEDSSSTAALLRCVQTRPQTSSPVQEVEGSRVDDLSCGPTSQQQDPVREEADVEDCWITQQAEVSESRSAAESKGDASDDDEREEANDSDDDWKPDDYDEELRESDSELQSKTTKKQKPGCSGAKATESKTENSDAALSCKVCRAVHQSQVTFVKHAWSHVDDPGSLCGVCGERSESVEALKHHLQNHHKTDDCHICGESFLSMLSLSEHVAAHRGERPYKCDVCHAAFALMASLENHQKLHEDGKLHKCYTCHKVFELKEELKAHRRIHNKKRSHLCGVCGKSLSDHRSLSRHKMIHSGERPHSCQVCGRSFKLPGTLRQHEKIHMDRERSYLCDVCCKMFLTCKQLQIHMRTHTNEKPYHCGECGKGFTTKGPLTVHMRVHTGETPYRCPDCGWSFKRKINLDNHVTVHSGVKPFVCGICGKACARKTYLTVHMRTHNGERPYKCTLCDKAFTQSHCLKTHMKSHMVAETAT
ncbi:zinc finger protein 62 homolog [Trachinotus anak]|uniref:zinc finger protein 62 homolog n=1 Tax=Trachinotus anak TaxID=443729 RepID=UPI0039F1E314